MNSKNLNKNGNFFIPASNNDIIKAISIQYIDQLLLKLKPLLVDFALSLYKQKMYKDEYLPIEVIPSIFGISPKILNKWISNGVINKYIIENSTLVSTSEIKSVISNLVTISKTSDADKIKALLIKLNMSAD
jgi:hypothetical protein